MKRLFTFIFTILLLLALSACKSNSSTPLISNNDTILPSHTDTSTNINSSTNPNTDSLADAAVSVESDDDNTETNTFDDIADDSISDNEISLDEAVSTSPCANGHNFTENHIESTCYSHGSVKKVCSLCGKTTSQQLPLLEHTNVTGYKQLNSTSHNVMATCAVCGHTTTTSAAHNWNDWKITSQPTKTEMGKKTRTCIDCGETGVENIPMLEYSNSEILDRILELVNIERQKAGLGSLEYYYSGQSAADIRAAEIIESFSHTRPDGSSCFTVFDEFNINYRSVGENIAYGYPTPEAVVEGWMNSDGHRANILNPSFTHLIVGYNNNYWVQLFIGI